MCAKSVTVKDDIMILRLAVVVGLIRVESVTEPVSVQAVMVRAIDIKYNVF